MESDKRETLDVDVLFVGGGPAGLAERNPAAALIKAHNENVKRERGRPRRWRSPWRSLRGPRDRIARYFGRRSRSEGAARAVPDFEKRGCPVEARSPDDGVWFLTKRRKFPCRSFRRRCGITAIYVASLGTMGPLAGAAGRG